MSVLTADQATELFAAFREDRPYEHYERLELTADGARALLAHLQACHAMLAKLQWSTRAWSENEWCPECFGGKPVSHDGVVHGGHASECALAALLPTDPPASTERCASTDWGCRCLLPEGHDSPHAYQTPGGQP